MIDLSFAKDQVWAVMGLGKSGLMAARALAASGADVRAWDDSADRRNAAEAIPGVQLFDLAVDGLEGAVALVLSPGIPHTRPKPHPAAATAKVLGVPIIGDVELLLRGLPQGDDRRRVVGITGTNGKSTTTALIGHILTQAGVAVEVGGNLGRPALDFNDPGPGGVIVLELSSYQLEITPSLAPDVAVWLNLSPDHIERHGDLAGYITAKRRMFAKQSATALAVVGVDDAPSESVAEDLRQLGRRVLEISGTWHVVGGVYGSNGVLVDGRTGRPETILDLSSAPALPGPHNAQNAAAAYAACIGLKIDRAAIIAGIRSFPGLAHRQERVAAVGPVTYVNDSKATNADAAARALSCYDPIYWIAGGQAKEGGIAGLSEHFPQVRRAYLIGEAAGLFARQIGDACPAVLCRTLESAVKQAHADATKDGIPGAVVLLSPAAASWDQFTSFEARGDRFRSLVLDLLIPEKGSNGKQVAS
ncbi:MAG: UDP-N-acetylmuramoyl-L-alanine--D-glutamate ligase [Alphaproteobacteria bacterium]|nr:UDP-N-acetylmuramoyl-L-alanine--D-glutamate ligase [Alphaproteobacteria bacterium]